MKSSLGHFILFFYLFGGLFRKKSPFSYSNIIYVSVSRVGVVVVVVVGRLWYGDGRCSCCSGPLDRGDDYSMLWQPFIQHIKYVLLICNNIQLI